MVVTVTVGTAAVVTEPVMPKQEQAEAYSPGDSVQAEAYEGMALGETVTWRSKMTSRLAAGVVVTSTVTVTVLFDSS